jgi:hypothetical protein
MSGSSINPSPRTLLVGIEAIAKAIGRNCTMDMYLAMARAEMLAPSAAPADSSLRDQFAGQALAALVGNSQNMMSLSKTSADGKGLADKVAGAAYEFADAMLAARGVA